MKLALTIPEAAEEIGMSEGFVKKQIREGLLVARKFGRHTRIESSALQEWVRRTKIVVNATDSDRSLTENNKNQVIEKTVGVRS